MVSRQVRRAENLCPIRVNTKLVFVADGAKCQGHSDFIVYAHTKISPQIHSQNNFCNRLS